MTALEASPAYINIEISESQLWFYMSFILFVVLMGASVYYWMKVATHIRKLPKMRYMYWFLFIVFSAINLAFLLEFVLGGVCWMLDLS